MSETASLMIPSLVATARLRRLAAVRGFNTVGMVRLFVRPTHVRFARLVGTAHQFGMQPPTVRPVQMARIFKRVQGTSVRPLGWNAVATAPISRLVPVLRLRRAAVVCLMCALPVPVRYHPPPLRLFALTAAAKPIAVAHAAQTSQRLPQPVVVVRQSARPPSHAYRPVAIRPVAMARLCAVRSNVRQAKQSIRRCVQTAVARRVVGVFTARPRLLARLILAV